MLKAMDDIDVMARTIYGEARGEYGRIDGVDVMLCDFK